MKARVFYADLLRAIAILYVVVSHAFAGVCWGMPNYPLGTWWFFNVCNSVIRLCVPLFVMLSGMLLLDATREEDYVSFVRRRYAKVLLPFFSWSMIYAFYESRIFEKPFVPWAAVLKFLAGPTAGHLYFMYIILGVYLVAPMLKSFVKQARLQDQGAVLLLWWGYLWLQFLFPDQMGGGPATTLLEYSGYFLSGYFLSQTNIPRKWMPGLALLSVLIIAGNSWATYYLTAENDGALVERFYYGYTPLVALYAAAFFTLIKQACQNTDPFPESTWSKAVSLLSRESFNIYLIHIAIMWAFSKGHLGFELSESTGGSPFIGVPLYAAATLTATLFLTAILKRIPAAKKVFVLN